MRVWVALPKKAALYTMKTSSEQCLTLPRHPLALRRRDPISHPMQVTIKTPEEQAKMRTAGLGLRALTSTSGVSPIRSRMFP